MKTTVVNLRKESYDIYIGRGSIWGNPFKVGPDGSRTEVIEKYRNYLLSRSHLLARIPEVRGKRLGCFCKPLDGFKGRLLCHGQILAGLADDVPPESIE